MATADESDSREHLLAAQHAGLDRRSFLAAGGLLGVNTIGVPIGAEGFAFPKAASDPVSMAMHIHGSFSEGIASMDAHLEQARRHGVDVIWWIDHDFRRTAHGYRQKYVRAMVVLASGRLAGFSNPLWILPDERRGTVRVPRSRR
jgi:hypothetical protein